MRSQSNFIGGVPSRNGTSIPKSKSITIEKPPVLSAKPPLMKSSMIKKEKKVVQVVLDDDTDEDDIAESQFTIRSLHKFTESTHTISQFDYQPKFEEDFKPAPPRKLNRETSTGILKNNTPAKYAKRDLFKSSLNFKEMCTGSNQDIIHVRSARRNQPEEVDPRYHTRRSLMQSSAERSKRSPTKKVTEQDEQVLIDKVREEVPRDPYTTKKSLMILPEKRLRAGRPAGVRDVHKPTHTF